jgi:hypothetical protein
MVIDHGALFEQSAAGAGARRLKPPPFRQALSTSRRS